jgi:5,10-methenyltetrahydromethanopterin hydrogenase
MKTFIYHRESNLRLLHEELDKAGFLVLGLIYHGENNEITVRLDDAETKDPTDVVNAHINIPDIQPNLTAALDTIRTNFATATTNVNAATNVAQLRRAVGDLLVCIKQLLRLMAYHTGTVEPDSTELRTGTLNLDK